VLSVTEDSVEIKDLTVGRITLLVEASQKLQRKEQQKERLMIMTDPASSDEHEKEDLET